ncbi:MAG: LPS export ABC transporter permease LptG [Alphaproteobacteria bacterium]|nr:LPS export ABC transporter permease LptG [Alphaproteobacteria bacterium]
MPAPKIISRYIVRQFLMSFFAVMLMLGSVILLFDIIEVMKKEAVSSFGFSNILTLSLLKLPNMILTILPFIVLIASIIVFRRLTKSHELVIIRAAGQSVWQFIMPLLLTSFVIGVFSVTAFNPFSAAMFSKHQRMDDDRRGTPHITSSQGLWLREHRDGKMYVLHARGLHQSKYELNLKNVSILIFSNENVFLKRIDASNAFLTQGFFELKDARIFENGKLIEKQNILKMPTELTLGKIQENLASPETISFWDLPEIINFFESSGFSAHSHRLHLQSLLVSPFLLMTMILISAVFTVDPNQRRGGGALKISGAVVFGFLLYFMTRITYALGFSTALPIAFAVWSPPLIFALISVSILLHQEDG